MKKLLSLLVLTVVITTACSSAKSQSNKKSGTDDVLFEYTASTRGAYKKVLIDGTLISTYAKRGDEAPVVKNLSVNEWDALTKAYSNIDVTKLETYAAPSNKNHADAAMAATLKITTNGTTYQTPTFDHGNPPAEVKALVEKIIELSELEK